MSETVLKRPNDAETDEDLLKMQEEWERTRGDQKPAVQIHRMKKRIEKSEKIDKNSTNSDKNVENPKIVEKLGKLEINEDNMENSEFSKNFDNFRQNPKISDKSFENRKISKNCENLEIKEDNIENSEFSTNSENFRQNPTIFEKNSDKIVEKSENFLKGGRFELDFSDIPEASNSIIFPVQERNSDLKSGNFDSEMFKYSKNDGFPEVLDLSDYYRKSSENPKKSGKKSFFAAEFDRINGVLERNLDEKFLENSENFDENSEDFQTENANLLKNLDSEKIFEMKNEISERFSPEILEFLRKRGQKSLEKPEKPAKISRFKRERARKNEEGGVEKTEKEQILEPKVTKPVEEMMNELEVLEEWKDREDMEKYNRLATDAIQLDLTAKFSRNLASRQQKNALRLFDNCKFRPENSAENDPLLELARSSIDEIKKLYLEEIQTSDNTISYQFGKGVNPIIDPCWTLQPVRRCLDFIENKRNGQVLQDDLEIVRLSLLWTLLLSSERKSVFFAFAEPNDFYVHLSEIYLIGAEILHDDVITECAQRLLNGYVLNSAKDTKISIRMNQKVAGLDAFMPFYEQLLKNYEQYSLGDSNFATAILIGAYLNAPISDSIEYRFALWNPKRYTIRQMTIPSSCRDLLEAIKHQIRDRENVIYEQHYVQYCSLLGAYVTSIRDDLITRDRNPMMFEIAAFEIGRFMEKQRCDDGKKREFQILTDIIRKSIGDKLMIS